MCPGVNPYYEARELSDWCCEVYISQVSQWTYRVIPVRLPRKKRMRTAVIKKSATNSTHEAADASHCKEHVIS